jgi:hypothetical protein
METLCKVRIAKTYAACDLRNSKHQRFHLLRCDILVPQKYYTALRYYFVQYVAPVNKKTGCACTY